MVDILVDDDVSLSLSEENINKAVLTSCLTAKNIKNASLCLRFSTDKVMQTLNAQWRDKDKVTDVLSFPMQEEGELDIEEPLGDIIVAVPFVEQEAKRLNLSVNDHMTHLIVHGTLHLLGFDHIEDHDATQMQDLENKVMNQLGLHMPYPQHVDEGNQ